MQELADLGHGRYYDGNDPFDLPRLIVKETQQVQREAIVEQDFTPLPISGSSILDGLDSASLPMMRGYVATTPKPQASVIIASRELDPVLAEWQYGLGRVLAWTSDVRNKWSARWIDWPDFSRFWVQLTKRAARRPEDPNRQVSVSIEGNQARIILDAQTGAEIHERRYLNFLPTSATLIDPRGVPIAVPLPQVAPGRYEASVPVDDDGVYLLDVSQTDPTDGIASVSSGFVVPYSPEYLAAGADDAFLEQLAGRAAGRIASDPAQVFIHDLPSVGAPRPLWPYLLVLAALVFVADVAVRRVRMSNRELRTAYCAIRRRLGYIDAPVSRVRMPPIVTPLSGVPRLVSVFSATGTPAAAGAAATERPMAVPAGRSDRLLAAKNRAARR